VSIVNTIPSAGEFGVVAVKLPAPVVVLDVLPASLTETSIVPAELSNASAPLNGVLLRNGSGSRAMKTTSPAVAGKQNISTSPADPASPLKKLLVAVLAVPGVSFGSVSAVAEDPPSPAPGGCTTEKSRYGSACVEAEK